MLAAIGAEVLDSELALARAREQFDAGGQLASQTHRGRVNQIVERLAARARERGRLAAAA